MKLSLKMLAWNLLHSKSMDSWFRPKRIRKTPRLKWLAMRRKKFKLMTQLLRWLNAAEAISRPTRRSSI